MVSTKNTLILVLVVAIISAGLTRYYFPKIETQTVDVIKEVIKTDIRTITRIVERPDGTKETIIDETDKSTNNKTEKHTDTTYANKDWLLSVSAQTEVTQIMKPDYGVQVQRRILGPFYLGGMVDTSKRVGVSLGMEF